MSGHDSPSARGEQIVSQLHLKALHAVLSARVPAISLASHPSPTPTPHTHRWFNLSLGDLPTPLDHHHHHHHIMDPTVIDILLCPLDPSPSSTPTVRSSDSIIERWSVQFDPPAPAAPLSPARVPVDGGAVALLNRRTYKRAVILLRSLYSVLRLLPAYLVFRKLSSSCQEFNYDISYRFASFAEPFTREKESLFRVYQFTPIETLFGQLTVSVAYRPDLSEFNFEVSSLQAPMIIADYVGSPAADPMRPFPSSPASLPLKAARVPGSAPPSFSRPHSWTSTSHVQGPERARLHKKGSLGLDGYRHSSPFSLSPSPSPPTRLVSETAPVSIPVQVAEKGLLNRIPNYSDPSRLLHLPPPSPTRSVRLDQPSSQESPSESRSFRKSEGLPLADLYSNLQSLKLRDNRDDSGRFSGVLSSCDSPRIGFSRSSSRLSMQDDDDSDFSCPFAVDDVDTSDSQTRNLEGNDAVESGQGSVTSRRSQDAAVGILVHMLKTAPPLRQDRSFSSQSSKSEPTADVSSSSSLSLSRKASDAMEELRSYREMKDLLLSQSGAQLSESVNQPTK